MRSPTGPDRVFRTVFGLFIVAALALSLWQCSRQPPGPSRVTWPEPAAPRP